MTAFVRHILCVGLLWGIAPLALPAQTTSAPANRAVSNLTNVIPPLPQLKSPVEQFRRLLALQSSERESQLTNRPPQIRQRILAKLLEYDAMKPDERELLLRNTQLRWYLLTFIEEPASERAAQLDKVPEADRPLVKTHLETWDRLSSDEQKEILKYEKVLETLLAPGMTNTVVPPPPPANPGMIKNLNAFLTLSADKREQMYASFQKFFELNNDERQATIGALPVRERMQMKAALKNFDQLPKPQRERCIRSFAKFSSMSEADRQEFLKNAERWREMSPAERQAWRDLVNKLPPIPPMPPGIALPPPLPRIPLVQQSTHP